MEKMMQALSAIRAPIQQGEYDLHRLVMDALDAAGIAYTHEARLAPRCRIDLLCGCVGIEVKRGRPEKARLLEQLRRYAQCPQVAVLVVVAERRLDLPGEIGGKPVKLVCLNRLWGIAL